MTGYNPLFIGGEFDIPLPGFQRRLRQSVLKRPSELRNEIYFDGIYFTLVMN